VFIRDASDLEPLTGSSPSSLSAGSDATAARVWYGHVARTNPDGSDAGNNLATTPAANWILGRQALFLEQTTGAGRHINGGVFDAEGTPSTAPSSTAPSDQLRLMYMGTSDIAYFGLDSPTTHGCIVGNAADGSDEDPENRLRDVDGATFTNNQYVRRAYDYTYGAQRLRVNPTPNSRRFYTWEVAQLHPYFAGHVSEFIVDFAADISPADGEVDRVTPGDRTVKWYSYWFNNPTQNRRDPDNPSNTIPYDDTLPLTYEPPASYEIGVGGPYDTEPRWDSNDSGDAEGADALLPHGDGAFVWRHDATDPGKPDNWPHMLRIRYRVHDPQGKLAGKDGDLGRWFQQIVKVERD